MAIFDYLFGGVKTYIEVKQFKQSQDDRKSKIITELKQAIRITKRYTSGKPEEVWNNKSSNELSDLWSGVAEIMRPFNSHLAMMFENKSDYWSDVNGFKKDVMDGNKHLSMDMTLDKIEKICEELERNWRKL